MKKAIITLFLFALPLYIHAQASGGHIRRPNRIQQNKRRNATPNNEQRTIKPHKSENVQYKRSLPTGKVNGYDAIDLGLSVRWATCNIGASQPEDYGGLYAYGDPTGKRFTRDIMDYPGAKTIIETDSDIAKYQLGNGWRLPTEKEMQELKERCSWHFINQGSVKGYRVTGLNGNSIFFPLAGHMPFSSRQEDGNYGYYWSGESPNANYAFALVICGGSYVSVESGCNYVYTGMSVRAVTK